ncbi:MAG: sulfatase activating formylglycine-generating enzyme [Verrucomicrobiales bacterium]|jgi:formylglycine-generating enzyme required for sulfatase activity
MRTALFLLLGLVSSALAEHRVALVIGNAAYPDAELVTPAADAKLVGDALRKAGFRVTLLENLKREEFQAAITDFAASVPTRGTALVYFSGYALSGVRGDNVLLPIDARPIAQNHIAGFQPQGVRAILTELQKKSNGATFIALVDGSYRHPMQIPDYEAGVVEIEELPPGSLVIYAADFGEVLESAAEGTSPFAKRLATALESGQSLDSIAAARQSTLEDSRVLTEPASKAVSEVSAAAGPGEEWISEAGLVFCWIPAGEFTIGSHDSATMRDPDELQVEVEIPEGFWMMKYEFTRGNLLTTIGRAGIYLSTGDHGLMPLNKFRDGDLKGLLAKLNETAPAGWVYALPTEAEWEYAARAGTTTEYSFGNDPPNLAHHGNFADRTLRESLSFGEIAKNWDPDKPPNRGDRQTGMFSYAHKVWNDGNAETAPIGLFPPNPWGLHDVHGNLAELTSTPYHAERTPPEEFDIKLGWVCKGGSWLSTPQYCRSAFRGQFTFKARENTTENFLGIRLVLKRK